MPENGAGPEAWLGLAEACARDGNWRPALEHYLQALRGLTDDATVAATKGKCGVAYFRLGMIRPALECYKQASATYRDLGDRVGEATMLEHVGDVYATLGHQTMAQHCHAMARSMRLHGVLFGNSPGPPVHPEPAPQQVQDGATQSVPTIRLPLAVRLVTSCRYATRVQTADALELVAFLNRCWKQVGIEFLLGQVSSVALDEAEIHALYPRNQPDVNLFSLVPQGGAIEVFRQRLGVSAQEVAVVLLNTAPAWPGPWITDNLLFIPDPEPDCEPPQASYRFVQSVSSCLNLGSFDDGSPDPGEISRARAILLAATLEVR